MKPTLVELQRRYPLKGDQYEQARILEWVEIGIPWCCAANYCEQPEDDIGFSGMCYCGTEDHEG